MKYQITIEADRDKELIVSQLKALEFKVIEIKNIKETRTKKQNAALHLWFTQLAEALNDAGFDMKKVIKPDIDISWTDYSVKEYLWRPVQQSLLGKRSTTQLKRHEIDKIFEQINRVIGERTGVYVPFPSIQSLENEAINKLNN